MGYRGRETGYTPFERGLAATVGTVAEDDDARPHDGGGEGLDELFKGAGREAGQVVIHGRDFCCTKLEKGG